MGATFKQVTTEADLDAVFEESRSRAVAILKHSSSCGISANVKYDLGSIDAAINVIVVQQSRELSNALAERIGHRHQSPQAFVIKDGKAIYHATHYGIDPAQIESKLKS